MREQKFSADFSSQEQDPMWKLDESSGREIGGLPSRSENFARLEEGRDYQIVKQNPDVHSLRPLQDFFVFVSQDAGTETRDVHAPHWRTSNVEDVSTFVTTRVNNGNTFVERHVPYYAVNTKGVGYLKPTLKDKKIEDFDTWWKPDEPEHDFGYKMLGLSSRSEFVPSQIIEKSQFLLRAGLRTEVYWGIARLQQVYYKGEPTSIDRLRELGVILKRRDYQPYMAVRLLKSDDRIEEARYADDRRKSIFVHAFEIFNREIDDSQLNAPKLNIERTEDQTKFFQEFFRRMGANMAVLLNIGYTHFRLHSSNITTAAEIVDLGTMSHWSAGKNDPVFEKQYNGVRRSHLKDMRDMVFGLKRFCTAGKLAGLKTGVSEGLVLAFLEGFDAEFKPKYVKEIQKTNSENARKWLEAILRALIINDKKLPSLLHDDEEKLSTIEDTWGITI